MEKIENTPQNETESYLQNFWIPQTGHTVEYQNSQTEIEDIIVDAQARLKNVERIVWLQDTLWKPTLKDIDEIVIKLGAKVQKDMIFIPNKKCYFKRPNTVEDYGDIVRQIRAYTLINNIAQDTCYD